MENDLTTDPDANEDGRDAGVAPQNITALRMVRFLLPLDDSEMGLADQEGLKKNRRAADTLLLWPPNLFAFTSEILSATGAYYLVVSPAKDEEHERKEVWPPEEYDEELPNGQVRNIWNVKVREFGREWRRRLNQKGGRFFADNLAPAKKFEEGELEALLAELVPEKVMECWNRLAECFNTDDIKNLLCMMKDGEERTKNWKYFVCLMTLHAVADEACLGWGIRKYVREWGETETSQAQAFAEGLLAQRGTLATIHEDRCRILPKRHTPNVGMTLRSISSNLALYHRSSLEVRWRPAVETLLTENHKRISSLKVLLLPWPYKVYARDFTELEGARYQANTSSEAFFQYRPYWNRNDEFKDEDHFIKHGLASMLENAREEAGGIDLVILPELALSKDNIEGFEAKLQEAGVSGYIAGVRYDADRPHRFNRNMVYCKFSRKERGRFEFPRDSEGREDYTQQKHHRWKLDETQIIRYQLGGSLPPNKVWWEGIKLSRRKVTFINVGEEITICPLICEDLARQEPISDLIRAVGPTLVVAILMDGPQKMSRWSAGYSSVLADDPRSSVLTFTCLGMVEKMQVRGVPKSRAVALWKDPLNPPQEIELEDRKKGIVLYLNVKEKKEITADGREEEVATPYLTLGGTSYI